MAARPIDGLEANEIDGVVSIRTADIEMGDRLRPVDEAHADATGAAMARHGQFELITVCRQPGKMCWTLVVGGHRLRGAQLHGIEYLKATIASADLDERRKREIAENLYRRDLTPLDRAAFVAKQIEMLRAAAGVAPEKSGGAVAADIRWQRRLKADAEDANLMIGLAFGWAEELAAEIGFSRATIFNDLMLHRRLDPGVAQRLRTHTVSRNATQLRALAKRDKPEQRLIAELLVNQQAKTIAEAVATLSQKPRPDAESKRLSAFIGSFQRMALAEKKGALHQLGGMLPAGHKLIDTSRESAPEDRYRVELLEACNGAFDVLLTLDQGEGVEDEEIHAAKVRLQMGLMALNMGAVAMPEPRA